MQNCRFRGMPAVALVVLLVMLPSFAGCSFGVMFGKFLMGEPTIPAQFRQMTRIDLTKGKHSIVVICTVPAAVDEDLSTLNVDLIDGIVRRMKINGINVVSADRVAQWIDDNGGVVQDPSEIARHFQVDFVAWIDLHAFTLRVDSSPQLLRGSAQGYVRAFKSEDINGERTALSAYNSEFNIQYPPHHPVSETGRSALLFQKEFVDRVCDQLAEQFYDHRPGTDF